MLMVFRDTSILGSIADTDSDDFRDVEANTPLPS